MTDVNGPPLMEFGEALGLLAAETSPPTARLVHSLSAPTEADMRTWRQVWPRTAPDRRRWIARQMLVTAEIDFQVEFDPLFINLLDDEDPEVRAIAIDGLWESHDVTLMRRFVSILRNDASATPRARSAAALGTFVQLGELGELDPDLAQYALSALVDSAGDESEDVDVRRRAIESAGFDGSEEVSWLIEEAIGSHERELRAGALRAMGNSADEQWAPEVVARLDDPEPELRLEAARAAGELAIEGAVPALVQMAHGDHREIRFEAIWALGEIGGREATGTLEALMNAARDPEMISALEDALAMACLAEGDLPWSSATDIPETGPFGDQVSDGDDEGEPPPEYPGNEWQSG